MQKGTDKIDFSFLKYAVSGGDTLPEKLEANEVCTAASFINTLQNVDFSEDYDFIKSIPNKEKRISPIL